MSDHTSNSIRLIIASDLHVSGECLSSAISSQQDICVVRVLSDTANLLEITRAAAVDIVLIDSDISDGNAFELTKLISAKLPHLKIILLGVRDNEDVILRCIEAGANGYLLKNASMEELFTTIRSVHRREVICSPQIAFSVFSRVAELASNSSNEILLGLTPRELQVLYLIADGLSNKQIAHRLNLSLYTIKNHVHNTLEKLKVQNRSEVVYYALRHGLLLDRSPDHL